MNSFSFSIGDVIQNQYLVLDRFSGSMGMAYLIENQNFPNEQGLPRRTILKTILPSFKKNQLFDQFLNEASIWIKIAPLKNVVHAFKVEAINGVPVVFAEYVTPGVLPNVLSKWLHYNLTNLEISLFFTVQLLDGLWYAYQDGIEFHGDLKPSNILVSSDLEIKINDWGFAKLSEKPMTKLELEWYSLYHRSSNYLAPEARSPLPKLSRGLDGFAIGVLLAEMITGEKLTSGITEEEVIPKLNAACFGLSELTIYKLAKVVSGLLTKDVNKRIDYYENYSRMIADLFTEVSGINVLDDSDAIILFSSPKGYANRVKNSESNIQKFRKQNENRKNK